MPDPTDNVQHARFEPLAGGVEQRSFRLDFADRRWVVRMTEGTAPGALDPETESNVTRLAAQAGIAPRAIGFDGSALVTEYIDNAQALTPDQLRQDSMMKRAALVLRRLHSIDALLRAFEPEAILDANLDALGRSERLDARQRHLAQEFRQLARMHADALAPSCICHNDLVASNLLDAGQLWLIDFEYAVRSTPLLDLAGLAALNDFDDEQRRRLVAFYHDPEHAPFSMAQFDGVVRMVWLMSYFWALAAACRARDPAPFNRFAREAERRLE